MNDEERHQFVNQVFDTFSWRSAPEETWLGFEDNWEYDWYNDGFDPVHPRAFDFQVFEAMRRFQDPLLIGSGIPVSDPPPRG